MVEAAGVFGGRAGSRAPSSPRHHVNNTTSLPRAALCTQGSAASCSRPGSPATAPAPGTRGGSFTKRHEPAAGGGEAEEWPPLSILPGPGGGWRWLLGVPRLRAWVAAVQVQIRPSLHPSPRGIPPAPIPAVPMSSASPDWEPSSPRLARR